MRKAVRSDAARTGSRTTYQPELVGVVRAYPKTEAAFEARKARGRALFAQLRAEGRPPTRKGVPDGWGRQRAAIAEAKQDAAVRAQAAIQHFVEKGVLVSDAEVTAALLVALTLVLDETRRPSVRLTAVAVVAEYTLTKPVKTAAEKQADVESWLASIGKGG